MGKVEINNNYEYQTEKFKANYKQSMSTGQLNFEVNVTASTIEELETISRYAIKTCATVCSEFNSTLQNTTKGEVKNKKTSPTTHKKTKNIRIEGSTPEKEN